MVSPFFSRPATTQPGSLAILHLKRGSLFPVTLREAADDGYAEGAVTNTRFGSYPHSTLLNVEWGSQIRASKIDTGSRGRKPQTGANKHEASGNTIADGGIPLESSDISHGRKRKSDDVLEEPGVQPPSKKLKHAPVANKDIGQLLSTPIEAGSGFTHILPPTPEAWTSSLDHRTQVVYTPDYSYILQRLQVRPGDKIIEAGAGSGSFTHAAARAVFNGYPSEVENNGADSETRLGKVYSFEYHQPRVEILRQELREQGLDGIVTLTHRDVYNDGFTTETTDVSSVYPRAKAIFLDLPAPWRALKHLNRSDPQSSLDPDSAVYLCSFSPCIEQVSATVSFLGRAGWVEIEMVEVAQRRIEVRREQIGLKHEGLRGANPSPENVEESLARLRDVEAKLTVFHANKNLEMQEKKKIQSKQERLELIREDARTRKSFKEGRLVHRTEPEIRTHTSYLVFAVLPRQWTDEDERACNDLWPLREAAGGKIKNDVVKAV